MSTKTTEARCLKCVVPYNSTARTRSVHLPLRAQVQLEVNSNGAVRGFAFFGDEGTSQAHYAALLAILIANFITRAGTLLNAQRLRIPSLR